MCWLSLGHGIVGAAKEGWDDLRDGCDKESGADPDRDERDERSDDGSGVPCQSRTSQSGYVGRLVPGLPPRVQVRGVSEAVDVLDDLAHAMSVLGVANRARRIRGQRRLPSPRASSALHPPRLMFRQLMLTSQSFTISAYAVLKSSLMLRRPWQKFAFSVFLSPPQTLVISLL
eukprot:1826550-Rhodomonas_salina.6